MKNIEYLEAFFRKHSLSGEIRVGYEDDDCTDEFMSTVTFEDGEVVDIGDITFDIDSDLEVGVFEKWLKNRNGESLMVWISTGFYVPDDIDTSSVEEYHKEMEEIIEEMKKGIEEVFEERDSIIEEQ